MDEYFLQYLWQFQKFNANSLHLTGGSILKVLHPGYQNHGSGPDFHEAKVKIDDLIWSGSVEIHFKSSDWLRHKHHEDRAYDNVILHVVWKHDKEIAIAGSPIPTIELKSYIQENIELAYRQYINQPEVIRCQHQLKDLSQLHIISMMDRAITDRLKAKSKLILNMLDNNKNDWEETTYQVLAKNYGFKTNQEPFERLANSLPFAILRKYQNKPKSVEALLFGMAGYLDTADDSYCSELTDEFTYLTKKHQLTPVLKRHHWKHARMRPANFPAVRLAQFASLITNSSQLFAQLIDVRTLEQCESLIKNNLSQYWTTHYDFEKETSRTYQIGKSALENIIINSIVPLLAAYSKYLDEVKYLETAQELLEQLPSERNHILKKWMAIGINPQNASESQALIHQYNELCKNKKCLQCNLGISILSPKLST